MAFGGGAGMGVGLSVLQSATELSTDNDVYELGLAKRASFTAPFPHHVAAPTRSDGLGYLERFRLALTDGLVDERPLTERITNAGLALFYGDPGRTTDGIQGYYLFTKGLIGGWKDDVTSFRQKIINNPGEAAKDIGLFGLGLLNQVRMSMDAMRGQPQELMQTSVDQASSLVNLFRDTYNKFENDDPESAGRLWKSLPWFAAGGLGIRRGAGVANRIEGVSFEGSLYRNAGPGRDPLFISSANVNAPHRYSASGEGALYFSTSKRLASFEYQSLKPHVTSRFDVSVDGLLDISNPAVRNELGVSLADITRISGPDMYTVTQQLGSYARREGYNGILAPSARADGGLNVIIFDPKKVGP